MHARFCSLALLATSVIGCGGAQWKRPVVRGPDTGLVALGSTISLATEWSGNCKKEKQFRMGSVDNPNLPTERCAERNYVATTRCIDAPCTIAQQPAGTFTITPRTAGRLTVEVTFKADGDETTTTRTFRVVKPDRLEVTCEERPAGAPPIAKDTFTVHVRVFGEGLLLPAEDGFKVHVGAGTACVRGGSLPSGATYECPRETDTAAVEVHSRFGDLERSLMVRPSVLGHCTSETNVVSHTDNGAAAVELGVLDSAFASGHLAPNR